MLQTSQPRHMPHAAEGVPAPRMSAPKVSVVIPTRNRAHCLGEAIDQTFEDWELIVVDDGSEDETGALVRQYFTAPRRPGRA